MPIENCRIINMSGGGDTSAWADLSAYCASKAAVVRLTEGLAMELAQTNVHVNAMEPSGIHTRMAEETLDAAAAVGSSGIYESSRVATSGGGDSIERIADLAVFLACGNSGSIMIVQDAWLDD